MVTNIFSKLKLPIDHYSIFDYKNKFFFDVITVGILYSGAYLCLLFADIVIARHLSIDDYGQYSFLRQSIILIITLSFLGIDVSIARVVSKEKLSYYRWRKFILVSGVIFIVSSLLISLVIGSIYRLNISKTIILIIASFAGCFSLLVAAFLRANTNYTYSQIVAQSWKFLLFGGVIVLILINKNDIYIVSALILAVYLLNALIALLIIRHFKSGMVEIPIKKVLVEGAFFWVNSSVLVLSSIADQFVITKILGYQELAKYVASWNLSGTAFLLFSMSIGYVIVPQLIKEKVRYSLVKNIAIILFITIVVLFVTNIAFHNYLMQIVYYNKYVTQKPLLILFVAIGSVRLLYVAPSAAITAWGNIKHIGIFSSVGIIGILLNILIAVILIPILGLIGAAIACLIGWIFRFILGIYITYLTKPGTRLK